MAGDPIPNTNKLGTRRTSMPTVHGEADRRKDTERKGKGKKYDDMN